MRFSMTHVIPYKDRIDPEKNESEKAHILAGIDKKLREIY